ncbi:hypothetical protein JMJ77_0008627, partial [Colletotrichum scovillei]
GVGAYSRYFTWRQGVPFLHRALTSLFRTRKEGTILDLGGDPCLPLHCTNCTNPWPHGPTRSQPCS